MYAVLWADRPYEGFDTSRDAFMGVYGAPSMPQAVKNGACTGSVAHGWAPVGAMQFTLSLAPGASQTLLLGLGYIENPEDAKNLKGLKKENLRDNMSTLEIVLNMLAETTTTELSKAYRPEGFEESRIVARRGGKVAGDARRAIEADTGRPAVTAQNAAQLNAVVTDVIQGVAEADKPNGDEK